ncbi:MAG: hypothetical protein Q4F41_17505, partial [Eubacteriales bacterium]|nr:hypothetical protein [Eubacteriales bacterium]
MIILKNEIVDTGMKWGVYSENGEKIVEYAFQARKEGTEIGKKLVNLTLLRYAVLDCLYIDEMKIDFQIDLYEKQYIDGEIDNMIEYSIKNHSLYLKKPIIKYKGVYDKQVYPTIELNKRKCYIGYSGGKDSRLCHQLLQNRFEEIIKFKIDFDDEEFNSDYH